MFDSVPGWRTTRTPTWQRSWAAMSPARRPPKRSPCCIRVRRLRGLLDSFEAAVSNRLSELHEQGRGAPPADVLSRNAHLSAKEAARRERRAKALANTKAFGEALAKGDVAAEHADVLADLTAKLDDEVKAGFFDRETNLVAESDHVDRRSSSPATVAA